MISEVLKATIKIYFEKNNLPLRRHLALNRGLSQLKGIKEKKVEFIKVIFLSSKTALQIPPVNH